MAIGSNNGRKQIVFRPGGNQTHFENMVENAFGSDVLYIPQKPNIAPKKENPLVNGPAGIQSQPSKGGGSYSQSSYNSSRQSYLDRIIALQNEQRERERAERERIRNERINAANAVYKRSADNLNRAANDSLQQAYIRMMKDKKAMPQQLQAMGVSGGATETTLANLNAAYGNNRTQIDKKKMEEMGLIERDRANAIAAANADAAEANLAAERNYTDSLISAYMSAMPKISTSRSTTSKSSSASSAYNAPGYKYANKLMNDGYSAQEINDTLAGQGFSEREIAEYLYQLGLL